MRQPKREKLNLMTFRQAARLANTTDEPMFLGMIRAVEPNKKMKKSRSKAGAMHGMTEGEKRRMSKETGPVKVDLQSGRNG